MKKTSLIDNNLENNPIQEKPRYISELPKNQNENIISKNCGTERFFAVKKYIIIASLLFLTIILCFSLYKIYYIYSVEKESERIQTEFSFSKKLGIDTSNVEISKKNQSSINERTYITKWKEQKQINSDFLGWIVFEDGLIDLPFVQTTNNDTYLNQSFQKKPSIHGTVFLDYLHNLNNNNITLYGHYVYNNPSLMFSPLEKLLSKEEYEKHQIINMYLEREKRQYEVVAVVEYKVSDYPIYALSNLEKEDFTTFRKYIEKNQVFSTGKEITDKDRLLTLQTCVRNDDDARWLVIAKEISSNKIE